MNAKTQNMAGYGGYGGNEEFGEYSMNNFPEYSQTNAFLHTKYHNMNQTEVPQMKFSKRQGNLNLKILKNLDLNYIIKTNNMKPLEDKSHELIFSEIKDEDYNDQNTPKLLRTFQYVLEYLSEKQSKLVETNEKLDLEYNQLINQSFRLEKILKENKKTISENSEERKEKEMILITYESIVNFNCNPEGNINLITKNINKTYEHGSATKNYEIYGEGKFYCHICNGKYFNTENRLESHMKRRHQAQMKKDLKRERDKLREEQIKEEYNKKIEDTKNYFQTMIQQKNEIFAKAKYDDEINMMKRQQKEGMEQLFEFSKKNNEEIKKMLQDFNENQEENNLKMINMANDKYNNEREKYEPQKIVIENATDINKLTNSISNLTNLLKQQNNKESDNIERENKILKDKIEILENQSKFLNNRDTLSYKYESRNITKNINYNIQNDDNNNNNNININNNSPKRNNNIPDNNNQININNKLSEINQNYNISNNIPNNKSNINQSYNDINNNNNENKISDNNIQNQNINNNYDSINIIFGQNQSQNEETIIQRQKRRDNDNQGQNNQNVNEINKILSDTMKNNNNDKYDDGENKKINTAENFNKNPIQLYQEQSPNKNENENENNNKFNKTAPNRFKKRIYVPKKGLLANSTIKELDMFYANFMNREQPILEDKNPNPNDYLQELIPEEKRKEEEQIKEDTQNFVENKTKKKYLMNFDDFDKKNKEELFEIISKTMNNINELNAKNDVRQLYFETAQKAIDLKLFEEDAKMMKNAYDNKGELKRSRSSSKAKIVIQNAENEKFDI